MPRLGIRLATLLLSFYAAASAPGCKAPAPDNTAGGSLATGGTSKNGGTTSEGTHAAGGTSSVGGSSATGGVASGGSISVGGTQSTGGSPATGGSRATGGSSATGGSFATTGSSAAGGSLAPGGSSVAGGRTATGGNSASGGSIATGGSSATGGTASPAGTKATGGSAGTGGAISGGGTANTGGSKPVGGTSASGGSSSTGGASTAGGSSSTGGTTTGGGSVSSCFGFKPVPNSQNTANFDPAAWYKTWKTKFYVDCGGGQARIANGQGSNNTVSEGMGYGMLLAVGNADKTAFDALWAYYKGRVDSNGLMNWSIDGCTAGNNNAYAATDADEDVAMALVQADAKWGGYKTDATNLINLIKKYETAPGPPSYLRPGDAANNGGKGEGIVNPSYFAIGYWHVWATYVGDTFWNQLATDAYAMLAAFQKLTVSGSTGALVPDWGNSQGQNPYGSSYYYDACRTPWRVAVDYAWFGTAAAQTFLQNVSSYIDGKGGIGSVSFDKNSAFLGPFALSGMAVSQSKADTYLNAWLSTTMDDTPYFQGSLRGLFLLLANCSFPKGP
jgi:endo-1,4-beta-D-glucanase Y